MEYHALFLRIIFCSVPLDFLGLENAFPRMRSQERVPLKTERLFFSVPFAFPKRSSLRSLSVPGTRSLLGYFCPVLYILFCFLCTCSSGSSHNVSFPKESLCHSYDFDASQGFPIHTCTYRVKWHKHKPFIGIFKTKRKLGCIPPLEIDPATFWSLAFYLSWNLIYQELVSYSENHFINQKKKNNLSSQVAS